MAYDYSTRTAYIYPLPMPKVGHMTPYDWIVQHEKDTQDDDLKHVPITFNGVALPDAKLIDFDPSTGMGKVQLSPGGPIFTFGAGEFGSDDEPDDPDAVLEELQNQVVQYLENEKEDEHA